MAFTVLALVACFSLSLQSTCWAFKQSNVRAAAEIKQSVLRMPQMTERRGNRADNSATAGPFFTTHHHSRNICPEARHCELPSNDLDVLFVLDRSGSIGMCDFRKELSFVEAMVCQLDAAVARVGVVSFASHTRVDIPLCFHANSCELVERVRSIRYHGGSTGTASALRRVSEIFDQSDEVFRHCQADKKTTQGASPTADQTNSDRDGSGEADSNIKLAEAVRERLPAVKRVFVITDGKSSPRQNPLAAAEDLRSRGAEVFALGVTRFVDMEELRGIASRDGCDSLCADEAGAALTEGDRCPEHCVRRHAFYLDEFDDFLEIASIFSSKAPGR